MPKIARSPLHRLCVPYERWGWEYVDPGAPQPSPLLNQQPVFYEPPRPALEPTRPRSTGKRVAVFAVLCLFGLPMAAISPAFLLILGVVAAAMFLPGIFESNRSVSANRAWHARRQQAQDTFDNQIAQWSQAIANHDEAERRRLRTADLWHPLSLRSPSDRVDVVGGVPEGWRQMLITFGATVGARQQPLLVLDLTQESIADGLTELAAGMWTTQHFQLPQDGHRLDVLAGLTPDEVAEIVAEAAETMRGTSDPALRATDEDLLRAVASQLDGQVTTGRLAAGFRVLQRTYDGDDLSGQEMTRLTRQIDLIGSGERVQDQIRFLRVALDLLTNGATTAHTAQADVLTLWRSNPITVITTTSPHATKKDFTDRALFHSTLQRLRDPSVAVANQVLVIAGADHLGATALEAMTKLARARGVRLVYFFERLRDNVERLVGSGHSATMIMRLGHAAEASAAAEYIGRGYSFKIAQYTKQNGTTDSAGGSNSWGTTMSQSWGQNAGVGASGETLNSSFGNSYNYSTGQSSEQGTNWSFARSVTVGTTDQRVYEFDIEPQTIQSLPITAFVLVEGDGSRRRAALADASPGIAALDRVSTHPGHLSTG